MFWRSAASGYASRAPLKRSEALRRDRPAIIIECEQLQEESTMAWTTPTLVEICIGLEINGYLPAEF